MADLNTSLAQHFMHVKMTQGEAVVQLNRVLDDHHGETVAVRFDVGHSGSAYPLPIKATPSGVTPVNLLAALTTLDFSY